MKGDGCYSAAPVAERVTRSFDKHSLSTHHLQALVQELGVGEGTRPTRTPGSGGLLLHVEATGSAKALRQGDAETQSGDSREAWVAGARPVRGTVGDENKN